MILYIHGFRSTENSAKAVQLKTYFGEQIHIASFPHVPEQAMQTLEQIIEKHTIHALMGSSLGGFYATYLSEKYGLKCSLINPSVRPFETLRRYLGENETHDGELFTWEESHMEQLKQYTVPRPTPAHYQIFLKAGDEILDYRAAEAYYEGAEITIDEGGTHRFDDFERYLEKVESFLI